MNFDYGFWVYYYFDEEKKTPLELFFRNLSVKLGAFEQQVKITGELYHAKNDIAKKKLEEEYDSAMMKANTKYNEVYEAYRGDPQIRDQIATHESGIDQIENWFRDQDEPRFYQFRDMKDSYYKSAVILLQAQFETEVKTLCELLRLQYNVQRKLKNIDAKKGILIQLNNYLRHFISLNLNELRSFSPMMNDFRLLRNLLTHEMGRVNIRKPWINRILAGSNQSIELEIASSGEQIRITGPDYLLSYQNSLRSYFSSLFWIIDQRGQYSILHEKLIHLFGFIDPKNLKISKLSVANIAQTSLKKVIHLHLEYDKNPPVAFTVEAEGQISPLPIPDLHTIAVKVIIDTGTNDKLEILNGIGQDEKLNRLKRNLEHNPELIFNEVFNLFYFQTSGRIMEITLSEIPS